MISSSVKVIIEKDIISESASWKNDWLPLCWLHYHFHGNSIVSIWRGGHCGSVEYIVSGDFAVCSGCQPRVTKQGAAIYLHDSEWQAQVWSRQREGEHTNTARTVSVGLRQWEGNKFILTCWCLWRPFARSFTQLSLWVSVSANTNKFNVSPKPYCSLDFYSTAHLHRSRAAFARPNTEWINLDLS